jgi:hypothetical protein
MSKVRHGDADNDRQMASRKRRPLEDRPADTDGASDKTVIRVRRGALRRFDQLKQKGAHLPVEITWDRRLGERRSAAGPDPAAADAPGAGVRKKERRKTPPFTWDVADFVVVGDEPPDDK